MKIKSFAENSQNTVQIKTLIAWIDEPSICPNYEKIEQHSLFTGQGFCINRQSDNLFV
jgi:hypothetical protein